MSSPWASVVPDGTVPKDYPRHFDGLSARPGAPVSRRSPRSRALRGHRAGFLGVGSGGDQGQRRPRAGHSRRLWERRLELGANSYGVLVPRASTFSDLTWAVGGTKAHLRTHLLSIANTRMPYPSLHELWCTTISQLEDAPDDWGRHLIDFQLWSASRLRPGS